jgi:hypothetical protein
VADLVLLDTGIVGASRPTSLEGIAEQAPVLLCGKPRCGTGPQAGGNGPIELWRAGKPVHIILLFVLHPAR